MSAPRIGTGIHVPLDRYSPPEAYPAFARAAADTGSIDWLLLPDQLTSWWPTSLWTPENTPFASAAACITPASRARSQPVVRHVREDVRLAEAAVNLQIQSNSV